MSTPVLNLVRVTLPDKTIQFIEVGPSETYADVCYFIRKNFDVSDSMVIIPQTDIKLQENTVICKELHGRILHVIIKNAFDHESQNIIETVSRDKLDILKKHESDIIEPASTPNLVNNVLHDTSIPLPLTSLLPSLIDMDTEPDYNRYNYM